MTLSYLEAQVGDDGGEAVGPKQGHHELLQTLVHFIVLQRDRQTERARDRPSDRQTGESLLKSL